MTPPVYATTVSASARDSDVVLVFRLQMPEHDDPTTAPEVATVVVPWSFVKGIMPVFAELVAGYENRNGVLPAVGFTDGPSG